MRTRRRERGQILPVVALALVAAQFTWQIATLDIADARNCLARFKSNQLVGWMLFLGIVAEMALGP